MAHPQHEQVRQRYSFRCGYCGVSEADSGGRLTVDHYHPVSQGGDESEDNLVYACIKCNQFKGDFIPHADDQRNERRVLHPLIDPIGQHVQLEPGKGRLKSPTRTGRFHIELLQLNRPELVKHRLQRQERRLLKRQLDSLIDKVGSLTSTITALELEVERLERIHGQ